MDGSNASAHVESVDRYNGSRAFATTGWPAVRAAVDPTRTRSRTGSRTIVWMD